MEQFIKPQGIYFITTMETEYQIGERLLLNMNHHNTHADNQEDIFGSIKKNPQNSILENCKYSFTTSIFFDIIDGFQQGF